MIYRSSLHLNFIVQTQVIKCHDNDLTGVGSFSWASHNQGAIYNKPEHFTDQSVCPVFTIYLKSPQVRWWLPHSNAFKKKKEKKGKAPTRPETPGRLSQSGPAVRTAHRVVSCGASAFAAIGLSQDLATVATNPTSHCQFRPFSTVYLLRRELGFIF